VGFQYSVLARDSTFFRPVLAFTQFPKAVLKRREWERQINIGVRFSMSLQCAIKGHTVHTAAARAIAHVLGYGNHVFQSPPLAWVV